MQQMLLNFQPTVQELFVLCLTEERHWLAPYRAPEKGLFTCILSCFQVHRQQESASSALEQLRQEASRQGHALAKVSKEKEVLVHEKAALEVRLAAVERDRQGLSEQLTEAR